MPIPAAMLSLILSAALASGAGAQVSHLGVMGDSLSDEYFEEDYTYAKNWTVQLVLYRGVDLGPLPGGTWGEPRRTGYKYNWARAGASSQTMIGQGQHTGLASQVSAAGLTHAVLFIGANDFQPNYGGQEYAAIYNGSWSGVQLDSYINQRLANVNTVLNTVLPTGVKLVLVNFMDWSVEPSAWQNPSYPDPVKRQRVSDAVARVNAGLRGMARARRLPYVDLYAFHLAVFGTNFALKPVLRLGNVDIKLWEADTPTNTNPRAGFVDDLVHPHTTIQGCYADLIMGALNAGYGAGLTAFTESEILSHAGIPYGGSDTLESQVGPYSRYITNFVCPADYNADGFMDGIDYDLFMADYESYDPAQQIRADYNDDGFVDGIDYDLFNADFEAGCL